MYAKIFKSIYDGTLGGDWKALVTFQQLLVLCDRQGVIDMTARAISARTGIPLEIVEAGITALEQPDPDSRTPDCEGCRIERIDDRRSWGWRVVNYAKYRELVSAEQKRAADRDRIAAKRAAAKLPTATDGDMSQDVAECRDTSAGVADVAQAEAEAEKKDKRPTDAGPRKRTRELEIPPLHQQVIDTYHEVLPELPQVKVWSEARRKSLDARIRERLADGKPADDIAGYWRKFFKYVSGSDWLMGRSGSFRADLEWLLKRENFPKVIEGRYANNQERRHGG